MRVSAGDAKGRRLQVPKTGAVRPTQDRVREAIFNALGARIVDARVLDLFAGAGGLGIEALSRGAAFVVFVEHDPRVMRVLRANLAPLGLGERSQAWQATSQRAVRDLAARRAAFDVVLMDPPYRTALASATLAAVCDLGLVGDETIVVVETAVKDVVDVPPGFVRSRERRYGDTLVTFVRREPVAAIGLAPDAAADATP
ncbi:MAG: 16S rRNA (guanine(966)-N(2))-methyltransferase RsmD [Armatimonadetes bacterium]|nr:16S rRNA (guanine(966)-N(2))-methyltransferase RsmD [Armatimonadota bacterium]